MMELNWPPALTAFLENHYGRPPAVEPLGGQSQAAVYRLRFKRQSLVLKSSSHPREALVYRHLSDTLHNQGISLPEMVWSGEQAGRYWLLLEYLPRPLPRSRWLADPEVLAMLWRLHRLHLDMSESGLEPYRPAWTASLNQAALSCFEAGLRPDLADELAGLSDRFQHLFRPAGLISGDPNPGNWGRRAGGTLALFDWERLGYGHPALDLAITVPGLGGPAAFRRVAQGYLALARSQAAEEQLVREIAAAKIWSLVEYLSFLADGRLKTAALVSPRLPALAVWLAASARALLA